MRAGLARLCVLLSGGGTNLQAVLDACTEGRLPAQVIAVFSNKSDAYGLERARLSGVPAIYLGKPKQEDRREYDCRLAEAVAAYMPDWIILAGWMRMLTDAFLTRFPQRVINLHPALPGAFPGMHAIQRAHEAYQRGEIFRTGVMIHLVADEGVDCGPVLAQAEVELRPTETLESLEARIHVVEHVLLVTTLRRIILDPELIQRVQVYAKSHSFCTR